MILVQDLRISDGVVVSNEDFRELLTSLDLYSSKFEDLLKVVMLAYGAAAHTPEGVKAFRPIEQWILDNYLEFRERLPRELKNLYLREIAFPVRERT
jgi:hypothetical protein